jgi:hypothetical protein
MLFTVPSPGGFYRTPFSAKQEQLESIHEQHLVKWKNEGRKPDETRLRRFEFMPGNLGKKIRSRIPSQVETRCHMYHEVITIILGNLLPGWAGDMARLCIACICLV